MQRIVFLADLHGNMPATLAMEAELRRLRPDEVWFLGDAVGKGPQSDRTCDWVRTNCNHFVGGNWDYGLSASYREGRKTADAFYWEQIGEERFAWLEGLPREASILVSGVRFRLLHGRPVEQLYYAADSEAKLATGFLPKDGRRFDGLICADSHVPFIRATRLGYAINTGSVGNGLDIPRAHALLLEGEVGSETPAPLHMTILSVPYDNEKAAAIAAQYPQLPNRQAYETEVLTGVYSR